ncbi:MAG: hypothetical protein ACHQLA_06825 [Ignavibacteriales bacterium]
MKKIFTYLSALSFIFILLSCDKPAPTELIDDSTDDYEVEVITKNPEDQYYTSGSDTSGITQDFTGITNLISVSGIKITKNNETYNFSLAQAFFFDKSRPIRYSDQRLLAYKTITPGVIKFDGLEAHVVPFRIRYRDRGEPRDTLLGGKYILYNMFNIGLPDQFIFHYNSNVTFEFIPDFGQGNNVEFLIPTPQEISGKLILEGRRGEGNLAAVLQWNANHERKISIIVGLIRQGQTLSIPIYRFRALDDGEVKIPGRLLNELPLDNFEKIVVTFIRSYEGFHDDGENDLLVSSQSIHSIVIDIP